MISQTTVMGLTIISFSMMASPSAHAQESDASGLIPREVLFGNPERTSVQISPDGKHIGYIAPHEGVLNIWVQSVDGGDARPLTSFTDRPIRGYSWAWNSEQMLFGRDKDGDENTHIYAVDITDGSVKDLTPYPGVKAMSAGSEKDRPDEVLVALNDRDPRFHDYYILNTRTGERELLVNNDEGYLTYLFDAKWNPRGRMQMNPDGGMTFEMSDDEGWFDYLTIGMEDSMTTSPMGMSPSGDIIYARDSRNRDKAVLVSLPATRGGADSPTILHASSKADISGAMMHPDTREPQAAVVEYLRQEWAVLDPSIQQDIDALRELDKGDFNITSRTADDRIWTVSYVQDAGPVRYWIWDRDAQEGRFLFTHRSDLEQYELAEMKPIEIKTRDGLTMPCYLTLPRDAKGPVPMVLLVHGGPWARDGWGYNPMHQWLADRGYAVLSPNFRGSTGFGKAYLNAGNREWYAAMQDDLVDATNWAIENKIAQPDKIAIMGGSYGGYATLAGLTRDPELYAAGVDIVGPSHVATLLNTIPPYWEPMKKMFESRVGSLDEPEFLDQISPLTHVDRISRPLMIVQGANDPRVKISESDQIVAAMDSRNLPVTYLVYPDEGHGMARPENMMAFNAITEEFLAKHLGGKVQPIGSDVAESSVQIRNKGNLELDGIMTWVDDGSSEEPQEIGPVEVEQLTEAQLIEIQKVLDQLKSMPPEQLPMVLASIEQNRGMVPQEDRLAFEYMVQQVKQMMEQNLRKGDGPTNPE